MNSRNEKKKGELLTYETEINLSHVHSFFFLSIFFKVGFEICGVGGTHQGPGSGRKMWTPDTRLARYETRGLKVGHMQCEYLSSWVKECA